jgi:hypothetical protein
MPCDQPKTTISPIIEPDDLLIHTERLRDGGLRVSISATCTRVEHAAYLRKATGVIEDLCSIAPPKLTDVDIDAETGCADDRSELGKAVEALTQTAEREPG